MDVVMAAARGSRMGQNEARREVRRAVEATGLGRLEFAKVARVDSGTLIDFLEGRRWPHAPTRAKIEAALRWPPGRIVDLAEDADADDEHRPRTPAAQLSRRDADHTDALGLLVDSLRYDASDEDREIVTAVASAAWRVLRDRTPSQPTPDEVEARTQDASDGQDDLAKAAALRRSRQQG